MRKPLQSGIAWIVPCALALAGAPAHAQGWKPERNVEVTIGLTAGSSQDRTGRALQKIWQDSNALGVPVTVVNRPGGGGQVGWAYLTQHAGDPHYLQIASPTLQARYITGLGTLQYTDFTPLALLGGQYLGAAVRPDSSVKSARDLMERLKRDPYSFSLGINSAGGTLHIMAGLLVKGAGGDPRKARIAVFQGAELITAGIGGHVDAIVTVASNILPHVETGKLNMLAVAAPRRLAGALASVPTFREQGTDLVVRNWAGVFGAKGLTAQQVAFWDAVLAATVATPAWKDFVAANQWEPEYLNSADYVRHLRDEDKRLRSALADLGLAKQ